MKIIDERNMQKTPPAPTTKTKQNKDRKKQRCDTTFRERVRANRFCCAFKLGFLQLICRGLQFLSCVYSELYQLT